MGVLCVCVCVCVCCHVATSVCVYNRCNHVGVCMCLFCGSCEVEEGGNEFIGC